jgi:hypothetical protein
MVPFYVNFIQELLANEPLEGLVTKDAEMVHEIRVRAFVFL